MTNLETLLAQVRVLPLIQTDSISTALQLAERLADDGMTMVEIVLRSKNALSCIEAISLNLPEITVGAGTVLDSQQAAQAIQSGAQFLVSPGFDANVLDTAQQAGLDYFPGCATATEVLAARNLGLHTLKFFPATASGGVPMLQALAAVFTDVSFIPTGGINASNLDEYLALANVLACGGSWLTPSE
jgi:2-dehydro-3-deoxyphosphogluconate aldolase/(4S)-4-hydroxy-2-oxoglutarate aldolase